ncbi:hypothetical protein ACQEVS_09455 [Streptomyces sp. CA-181903]|uniref:hypothetical protein n=1 Tax=Streptomyces sp. CA-181903 TaxID=3240055 RepID=UPI003D910AA3
MRIAALITWVITALGGFHMLGVWIRRGGVRQQRTGTSRLPAPVVFGHFALAAIGLVVWIGYLATGRSALAWAAFGLLLPVALLGFVMPARWIPAYRARAATVPSGTDESVPAERHFPVAVVLPHGLFAVATLVLVLLTALGR